nr:MAG TPA: hypothetical protein [Caudoviricetes sp.]
MQSARLSLRGCVLFSFTFTFLSCKIGRYNQIEGNKTN